MLRAYLFFRFLLQVALVGVVLASVLDESEDGPTIRADRSGRSFLWNPARRIFGGGHQQCGPPEACPPHHCRLDDAVVHGYCCGCAHPTDRVQVRCPPWLQCPLSPIPLCDDYNWMMDCCC